MTPPLKVRIYDMLPSPIATRTDCILLAAELGCAAGLVSHWASRFGRLQPVPRYLPPTAEIIELIDGGTGTCGHCCSVVQFKPEEGRHKNRQHLFLLKCPVCPDGSITADVSSVVRGGQYPS